MRILIVEDEAASCKLLGLFLADFGRCESAGNGREAVAAVEQAIAAGQPYDLICMDVMMPEMDGMEALRQIRRMEFKHFNDGLVPVKVLMTTAKDAAADMTAAFGAGAEGYLTKPISREQLIEQLHALGLLNPPGDSEPPEDTELAL